MKINPNATLDELNRAFPKELRWGKDEFPLFVDIQDAPKFDKIVTKGKNKGEEVNNFSFEYFTDKKDIFQLQDGTKAVMRQMWWEEAFNNIVKHAEKYGIEVAKSDYQESFGRGEYRLEYINNFAPTAAVTVEFAVSGRMSVATLKKNFKDTFGATLRVYSGTKFADDKATLASLRKSDNVQKGSTDFQVNGEMLVGDFEQKFQDVFGIKVRIAEKDDRWTMMKSLTLT